MLLKISMAFLSSGINKSETKSTPFINITSINLSHIKISAPTIGHERSGYKIIIVIF